MIVSVIIVFHRDNPFFRPAIDSVLKQTWRDFELLLVDNGTGLSSGALGECGRDPRVRFVRLPRNEGIPGGHNAGVAAARGEFVALLDYDDLMLPNRLEKQLDALRADQELGLVSSRVRRVDQTGRVIGEEFTLTDAREQYAYSQYAAPFPTPACLGRREVFQALPYRPEFSFAADFDFQARAVEHCRTGAVDEVLFHYRWYAAQTTQEKAVAIERDRAAIRIITARRRAGRLEEGEQIKRVIDSGGARICDASRAAAQLALADGFPVLAAYQARRMFASRRTPAFGALACGIALRACRRAIPDERLRTARMFLKGPVKALEVRPGFAAGANAQAGG